MKRVLIFRWADGRYVPKQEKILRADGDAVCARTGEKGFLEQMGTLYVLKQGKVYLERTGTPYLLKRGKVYLEQTGTPYLLKRGKRMFRADGDPVCAPMRRKRIFRADGNAVCALQMNNEDG